MGLSNFRAVTTELVQNQLGSLPPTIRISTMLLGGEL